MIVASLSVCHDIETNRDIGCLVIKVLARISKGNSKLATITFYEITCVSTHPKNFFKKANIQPIHLLYYYIKTLEKQSGFFARYGLIS